MCCKTRTTPSQALIIPRDDHSSVPHQLNVNVKPEALHKHTHTRYMRTTPPPYVSQEMGIIKFTHKNQFPTKPPIRPERTNHPLTHVGMPYAGPFLPISVKLWSIVWACVCSVKFWTTRARVRTHDWVGITKKRNFPSINLPNAAAAVGAFSFLD